MVGHSMIRKYVQMYIGIIVRYVRWYTPEGLLY